MSAKKNISYRRSYWMIDPNLQGKYLIHLLLIACIAALLSYFGTTYINIFYDASNPVQNSEWTSGINSAALFFLLFSALVIISISVALSHRIAGPGYRIREALKKISDGDYSVRVSLRKNDYFKTLAEDFNQAAEFIESARNDCGKKVAEAITKLDALKKSADIPDNAAKIDEIVKILNEIKTAKKAEDDIAG